MSVALIGFMGAGKSTAASAAAAALGLEAVDVDDVIEARLGKSIHQVFEDEGEERFREVEADVTVELLGQDDDRVLALGGGAVGSERIRHALAGHSVIWLDIDADTAWARASATDRPLAREREAFDRLHAEREPIYASLADAVVPAARADRMSEVLPSIDGLPAGAKMLWAISASGDYPAYVGAGLLQHGFWPETVDGRRFLVTDGNAGRLYAGALEPLAGRVAIMPGEQSKTVAHADVVWSELARAGMTRADLVVALGGGVVGDLAGFCAATYQRGVRYVQVPTTLVSQVDSAYGGKTGVDLPEAKNYVGAYHQPAAVLADPETLRSLPAEELAAGYAEVLKTGLIAGGWLWAQLEAGADPASPEVIAACALTKLRIVARDERDAGPRQALNLGHTIGHAIEAVTGYASYRHGEAVGLGLLAALRLSGLDDLRGQVSRMLAAQNLPTTLAGADPEAVVAATAADKKRVGQGGVPFVLLDAPGRVRTGCQAEPSAVLDAVKELAA